MFFKNNFNAVIVDCHRCVVMLLGCAHGLEPW